MSNDRGYYGSARVGQSEATTRTLRQVSRIIEPRSVFYDPSAIKPDPETQKAEEEVWREHPTRTGGILIATFIAIVGIGVVGAKRGLRLM